MVDTSKPCTTIDLVETSTRKIGGNLKPCTAANLAETSTRKIGKMVDDPKPLEAKS